MEREFWLARWQSGQINFHEGRPNRFLDRHAHHLGSGRRVLVPLCGKAVDVAYLAARGHQVVGVELAVDAVDAFFAEHALRPTVERAGDLAVYRAGAITIVAGDLFATTAAVVGPVDALYDRAALIALPAATRPAYVAHLRGLLPAGAPGMVVTIEYPQALMDGPPFSVDEDEVRRHWAGAALVDEDDVELPRLRASGQVGRERCFTLRV